MNPVRKRFTKNTIRTAFRQGDPDKYKIMRMIIDACEKEYYEDNHVTRISAIVSWLLMSDPVFWKEIKNETNEGKKALAIAIIKEVLGEAVDDAVKGF